MLRPYTVVPHLHTLHNLLCLLPSIPGILRHQWVRIQLGLRHGHQDVTGVSRPGLELPLLGVLAVADQVLAAFGFAGELEHALLQGQVAGDWARERRRDGLTRTGAPLSS